MHWKIKIVSIIHNFPLVIWYCWQCYLVAKFSTMLTQKCHLCTKVVTTLRCFMHIRMGINTYTIYTTRAQLVQKIGIVKFYPANIDISEKMRQPFLLPTSENSLSSALTCSQLSFHLGSLIWHRPAKHSFNNILFYLIVRTAHDPFTDLGSDKGLVTIEGQVVLKKMTNHRLKGKSKQK